VIGDEGLVDVVVIEEFPAVTGVFAGDPIDLVFQNAEGADGDVLKIPDGGGDEIECGWQYS